MGQVTKQSLATSTYKYLYYCPLPAWLLTSWLQYGLLTA